MNTINMAIINRLLQFMGDRNLTQYKLAQICGLPFATIKSIMQRRAKGISLRTVILIANGLGISASEFLDDPMFLPENLDLD